MEQLSPRESVAAAILHLTVARELMQREWEGMERIPGYAGVFYSGIPFQLGILRKTQDALRKGADPLDLREEVMLARSIIGAVRYGES